MTALLVHSWAPVLGLAWNLAEADPTLVAVVVIAFVALAGAYLARLVAARRRRRRRR